MWALSHLLPWLKHLLNKKSQIPPHLRSRSSSFAFILHDVTHCRDFVTHQLLLSSMWSMLPERNHYGCVTKKVLVNELNFDRIFTKWVHSLQLEPQISTCIHSTSSSDKSAQKHETGLSTRSFSKAKTIKLYKSPSQPAAPIASPSRVVEIWGKVPR